MVAARMNPVQEPPAVAVAEIQGLYGPFVFSEKLLQRVWARGGFDGTAAVTAGGQRVEVLHPGRWNGLGGPDFLQARLRIAGVVVTGDVEVHLRAVDWVAHGHSADPAYRDVVLHVVLFPPSAPFTAGVGGRLLPVLALLPLLPHDLEEYAAEAAIEALASRPEVRAPAVLAALTSDALAELLCNHARARWSAKVAWAAQRVARLGWEEACHHTALEILGYRFNRAPMLAVAGRYPLAAWAADTVDVAAAWAGQDGRWRMQGVRPLNQPRVRLRQYAAWVAARPDWCARLRKIGAALPVLPVEGTTAALRRAHGLTALRGRLADEIGGGKVGGTRFDNLVCDGFLPLLAAEGVDPGGLWSHWFAGDQPAALARVLQNLGVTGSPARPASHGAAQGLLGWLLAQGADPSARG